MRKISAFLLGATFLLSSVSFGQNKNDGGISPKMLQEIKKGYTKTPEDRALRNAISENDIAKLVINGENANKVDTYFSHKVNSKGITNQRSSGRCWLFTGLNVYRAQMITKYDMGEFIFSNNYPFFWDQLEKANLFLQGVIDTRHLPREDKMVEWLFQNPLSDGGQFTGVSDILMKYGVVPDEVMPETYNSNNTRMMAFVIKRLLRESGLKLRDVANGRSANKEMEAIKVSTLRSVYRVLALCLGEPPTEFEWTFRDKSGKEISTNTYTPKSYFDEYIGIDLSSTYVMLMNDPSREYYKLYEIDFDRHRYDGENWKYVNLPMDEIKEMAAASIKDSTMMYMSCDVSKYLNRQTGIADVNNFDYESLFGVTFGMNKKQRISSYDSGSTHAMTLMAVDIDQNGKTKKWMVENSWGSDYGHKGFIIMSDDWFDQYLFRLVINKKYASPKTLEVMKSNPILLPAWDPLFAPEM